MRCSTRARADTAAAGALGVFRQQADIGETATKGSTAYDAAAGSWRVTASGANIWGAKDAFHFVWAERSGDLHIAADVDWIGKGKDPHRKAGLVGFRQNRTPGSPYADVMVHGDGMVRAAISRGAGRADLPDRLRCLGRPARAARARGQDRCCSWWPGPTACCAPCRGQLPHCAARALGFVVGAHFYPARLGPITLGLGGEMMVAQRNRTLPPAEEGGTPGPTVHSRMSSVTPQFSFNFGKRQGWSYISGGIGRTGVYRRTNRRATAAAVGTKPDVQLWRRSAMVLEETHRVLGGFPLLRRLPRRKRPPRGPPFAHDVDRLQRRGGVQVDFS